MVKLLLLLFGITVFQRSASSEDSHPIITSNVEEDITINSEPYIATTHGINNEDKNQRQKRFFDYVGFDYPPFDFSSGFPYSNQPHYTKRDSSQNTAVPGAGDALSLVYKRLHELVRDVRLQNVPQSTQIPISAYIPVFYIPQFDCGCTSNRQTPTPPVNIPSPLPPVPSTSDVKPTDSGTTTDKNVTIEDRFPELDDTRRNWGLLINKTDLNDVVDDGDGSRPINLDPVPTEQPIDVPVPPVDHGTVQAGKEPIQSPSQITTPRPKQNNPGYPPALNVDSQTSGSSENFVPSLCDGAIISCCNRAQVTAKCFELLGCNNPSIYGKPCSTSVQLMVAKKFQNFHARRSG